MTKPPDEIYLQWDPSYPNAMVTWYKDRVNDDDVAYVLKSNALTAERALAEFKVSSDAEADQFNAGYEAGEKGGLDTFSDQPQNDSWRNGYYAGSYDRLTKELTELKERTRWIPIGERQPTRNAIYPVLRRHGVTGQLYRDEEVWNSHKHCWEDDALYKVIYWFDLQLPEPPEKDPE